MFLYFFLRHMNIKKRPLKRLKEKQAYLHSIRWLSTLIKVIRIRLANLYCQTNNWHPITKGSGANEPPHWILEIQHVSFNLEVYMYMLQNNVQCLRSRLKSSIWCHEFQRTLWSLCAKVINNISLHFTFCNFKTIS